MLQRINCRAFLLFKRLRDNNSLRKHEQKYDALDGATRIFYFIEALYSLSDYQFQLFHFICELLNQFFSPARQFVPILSGPRFIIWILLCLVIYLTPPHYPCSSFCHFSHITNSILSKNDLRHSWVTILCLCHSLIKVNKNEIIQNKVVLNHY